MAMIYRLLLKSFGHLIIDRYLLGKGYEEYFSNGLNTLYIDSKQTR